MVQLAVVPVIAAGAYLVALGIATALRPDLARWFLDRHASSARAHFAELFVRLIVGVSFVLAADQSRFATPFLYIGWLLIGTTLVLCALPWRLHRRFAMWSVPIATRRMGFLAIVSFTAGAVLLLTLFLPRGGA